MEESDKKKAPRSVKKKNLVDFKKLFKFKSFSERIASIHVNVTHQVGASSCDPDDEETFFNTALLKWKELNCTLDFLQFLRGVQGKTGSLAQIVHHKNDLINHLRICFSKSDTLAYEPLLDLLVQLARDLQAEFYPHFSEFFPLLVAMCSCTQNVELIQCVFNAFAYLFKFLWRHMIKDLEKVFELFSELLLQSQKAHMQQFAAESFAFLLRKVRNQSSLVDMILSHVCTRPEICEGVGHLMFEICRGVSQQFHSCTTSFLPLLLTKLGHGGEFTHELTALCDHPPFRAMRKMIELMAEYTKREFCEPVWGPLLDHLSSTAHQFKEMVDMVSENDVKDLSSQLGHTLHLIGIMASWRRGSRVRDASRLFQAVMEVLELSGLPCDTLNVTLHLSASLILVSQDLLEWGAWTLGVVKMVSGRGRSGKVEEVEVVIAFFQEISQHFHGSLPNVLPYCLQYCESVTETSQPVVIRFLAELCLRGNGGVTIRDSCVSVPLLSAETFVLDITHVAGDENPSWSVKGTPRRSNRRRNQLAVVRGISSVLRKMVELGLHVLSGVLACKNNDLLSMDDERLLQELWCALVCVQYTRPLPNGMLDILGEIFCILKELLSRTTVAEEDQKVYTFLYSQTLSTIVGVVLKDKGVLETVVPLEEVLATLKLLTWSLPVLISSLQYLSVVSSCDDSIIPLLSSDRLIELLPVMSPNLSSPVSPVRLLTLQILCLFEQLPLEGQYLEGDDKPMTDILEVCLRAEEVPSNLESHRNKLLWLQNLKYGTARFASLPEVYKEVPLRYLVGVLYINFSLLWEPTSDVIRSHAVEENKQLFWKVFGQSLDYVSQQFEQGSVDDPIGGWSEVGGPLECRPWHGSIAALFQYQMGLFSGMECRSSDRANHRMLLWKSLTGITNRIVESRSHFLVPLFLRFITNEYSLKEDSLMETQDISSPEEVKIPETERDTVSEEKMDVAINCIDDDEVEEEVEKEDQDGVSENALGKTSVIKKGSDRTVKKNGLQKTSKNICHKRTKNLTKCLVVMLKVFTSFQNPKALHMKEELWTLYMKLLVHKWSEVQGLALAGLMSFKPPYLRPYLENFDRLLEDSSFKEELVNFRFDADYTIVSSEHREKLLPVLIRVLYGRMQRQTGDSSSKVGGTGRKGLVLRFLGSCEGGELGEFIDLLIAPFSAALKKCKVGVDTRHVIPLKRQQGFLNMLGLMISDLGPKLLPYLPWLLQIVMNLRNVGTRLLEARSTIQPHFVSALKILRQLTTTRVAECFKKFTEFDFSPYHEQLLSDFVWPHLPQLPHENLQSPTPLLKLLAIWTTQPHYWCLLCWPLPQITTSPDNAPDTILKYVFDCILSPKASIKVCSFVMDMAVTLLTSSETFEVGEMDSICDSGSINGVNLVRPFVPHLLEYLSRVISERSHKGRLRKVDGQVRDLDHEFIVLSRVSSFVSSPEQSSTLIELLLPFLLHSDDYKKHEGDVLRSISNLVGQAQFISQHIRSLSQLLRVIKDRSSRKSLCEIFKKLSNRNDLWKKTAEIISKLNSWDSRLLDEPDYDLRLEGFMEAKEMLVFADGCTERKWSSSLVNSVYPILQNALYYLLESADMSLRDAAASYVSNLIKHITPQDKEAFNLFILTSMVTMVKQGLRSKQDFARLESISTLSDLVKTFSQHPRFQDLFLLSHADPEVDFFLNVHHIQLHRRTRAFRKLCAVCSGGSIGQTNCLGFVLPLANHVIFLPTTNVEQNLVAEAVNVIGAVSSHLSWARYSFILCHYLRLLPRKRDNQKNLIKVIIAILDNFHFDLSHVTTETSDSSFTLQKGMDDTTTPTKKAETDEMEQERKADMIVDDEEEKGEEESGDVKGSEVEDEDELHKNEKTAKLVDQEERKLSLSQNIYNVIVKNILPKLQEVLTKKLDVPGHNLSQQVENGTDSEVLRIPVAMAMTKLLLVLPKERLQTQLPNLLLKVCSTLKHRSRDVRDVGRNTLVKMASSLGPRYLRYILKEMKDALTRGYMLHVLSYSLHHLLCAVFTPPSTSSSSSTSSHFSVGDLDPCLDLVSDILKEDLFGVPAEERESGAGVAKIPESKTPQSFNTYEIVARFISPKLVPQLLAPMKEMLELHSNSRTCRVVADVFHRVASGIQLNPAFTPQALLVFVYGLLSNAVPQLAPKSRAKPADGDISSNTLHPPDSRLLPRTPGRSGPKPVSMRNVGSSIVTEFGLQLLHVALKHNKFDTTSKEQLQMLDPFILLLSISLSSSHAKVLCRTLQCLIWMVRLPLPALSTHLGKIISHIFNLLRRYARAGMAVGANKELVLSSFKAMTVIVRDFKKHDITENELRILLSFVEEDVHDYQKQSTAFPLLKAILCRKLVVTEVYAIVLKVASLSLTSDSEHVRLQSRQVVLQFMMDYPLGKKLNSYLDFHLTNLSYKEQSGRESMLEQLNSIFTKFPERLLNLHSSYFFVPLSLRLINEEAPTCKKMAAAALKSLMARLSSTNMNEIAGIIETWIQDSQPLHKRLGMLALGLLVESKSQSFTKRLPTFLPLIQHCILLRNIEDNGDKKDQTTEEVGEVEACNGAEVNEGDEMQMDTKQHEEKQEAEERGVDRLLLSTLGTLSKILQECDIIRSPLHAALMSEIWGGIHTLLLHPHSWVRLFSARLFGLLFAAYSPEEIIQSIKNGADGREEKAIGKLGMKGRKRKRKTIDQMDLSSDHYILQNAIVKVQELCHMSCLQLNSALLNFELAGQVTKNLLFLTKVLHQHELEHAQDGEITTVESDPTSSPDKEEGTASSQVNKVELFRRHMLLVSGDVDDTDEETEEEEWSKRVELVGSAVGKEKRGLKWLAARMSRLARYEAGCHPKESIKRTHVFQWTAAVSLDLGPSHLPPLLPVLLPPLHRELEDSNHVAGKGLHDLATEVVDLMKGVCGKETFSRAYAQVQKMAVMMREKRRKQAVMEAVMQPEKFLLRKRRKNILKKESKRRKIFSLRPDSTAAATATPRKY